MNKAELGCDFRTPRIDIRAIYMAHGGACMAQALISDSLYSQKSQSILPFN